MTHSPLLQHINENIAAIEESASWKFKHVSNSISSEDVLKHNNSTDDIAIILEWKNKINILVEFEDIQVLDPHLVSDIYNNSIGHLVKYIDQNHSGIFHEMWKQHGKLDVDFGFKNEHDFITTMIHYGIILKVAIRDNSVISTDIQTYNVRELSNRMIEMSVDRKGSKYTFSALLLDDLGYST